MSIRWKLAIFVSVVTVVPAILISFFVSQLGAHVIEQEVEGGFNLIARVGEAGVDQYFGRITSQAADWSSDGQVREYLAEINTLAGTGEQKVVENGEDGEGDSPDGTTSQRRASQEALSTYIVEQKHALSEYVAQTDIINSEGVVVASTNTQRIGTSISPERLNAWYDFSDALEAETGQTFVNQIRVEDESEVHTHERPTTMFHVSSPVNAIGDNGRGVLVNHIDIEGLNEVLRQHTKAPLQRYQGYEFVQAILSSLELYLVRKDGRLLATSSRFEEEAELSRVVDTEPVRTCVEDGQSMNGVYQDYRGVEVIGASRCPEGKWWVLLIEVDRVDALAPARFFRNVVAGIAAVASGIAIIFAIWAGHVFTRRIKRVLKAVKKIERGDFSSRVEVDTEDEVGQVGRGINDMAKQLEMFYGSVNEMYENLFEKSPFGIYTIDKNGLVDSFNPQMVELAGLDSAEQAIGENAFELAEYKRIGLADRLRRALQEGVSFTLESEFKNTAGQKQYRRFVGIPIHRPGHPEDVDRILVIVEDISERKTAEEQLEGRTEQLEGRVQERTRELQKRVEELERFKNVTVGRELKMRELKERIEELEESLRAARDEDNDKTNNAS